MNRATGATVRAVVLDLAGTSVDHGSRAPAIAIGRTFAHAGVPISEAEARGPMGLAKRDHIAALLAEPGIASRWRAFHGQDPADADIDELYQVLTRIQLDAIRATSSVIEGVGEALAELRARGVVVGATTGYTREAGEAAAEELRPDVLVTVDDVPAGRPEPWMLLRAMERLRIFPPALVVKVGDTPVDMAEGRNAGAWAVGVTDTGNEMALAADALAELPPDERASRTSAAADRLCAAGAHMVVPSAAGLIAVVRDVERRLAAGERP